MTPVESITRSVEAYLWRLFLQLTLNYKNSIHYKVVADRPMLDFFRFIQDNLIYYNSGFSIEGGTRRLISCYFRIYSCLLCVAFLLFCSLFVSNLLFRFLHDCDPNKTRTLGYRSGLAQ